MNKVLLPEQELLLLCASVRTGREQRCAELVREIADWHAILAMGGAHGLTPLLYRLPGQHEVPESSRRDLEKQAGESVRRSICLTAELVRLAGGFEAGNITFVPIRGPVMAAMLYGELGLREFSDLDLLIHESDLRRIRDLLSRLGYDPLIEWNAATIPWNFELSFRHRSSGIVVDLHWRTEADYYPFRIEPGILWASLKQISFAGRTVASLPTDLLLISLCAHGARHHWQRLSWLCDIDRLVRLKVLDWPNAARQARTLDCEPALLLGCLVAADLLDTPVPSNILEQARGNSRVRQLAMQVRERMFVDFDRPYTALDSCRFHWRLAGWRKGLRYGLGVLLVPTDADWAWVSLPPALCRLYYPLRLVRLAWKRVRGAG